ncbi:LuxR family transcriptional regulator [Nocardioides sp. SYSU D00038]|uniref:helix-turn-helix transcriptional regulator n=1 Tax=Nocardioides sp. SYSU D00038 TaxID=2812554 RepID=UPI0019685D4D|nr:LuxR family transcriptional regulator [Nocardioides sp. SYSU D00038]
MLHEVRALVRTGRIREGMTALGLLLGDPDLTGPDRVATLALLVDCRLARGDLAEAMGLADELTAHLDDPGDVGALAHHARGELAAALGDPEPALDHYRAAGRLDPEAPVADLPWRSGAALAMLRTGSAREGAVLAREQAERARAEGSAYGVALALRTLATVDAGIDRVAVLREARALLGPGDADRLAAQVDTDLAGLLLVLSPVDGAAEALALLRAAEDHAGRQELWPLQGRVRRLLDRVGESPRRVESEALAALTAAEQRVARLAAEGLTNRQIATELVVTIKAVEWHLSHVYRKLGISSRTRLAETIGAPA